MSGIFRGLTGEYRDMERHEHTRAESVKRQLAYYDRRLRLLLRATLLLTLAIISFILGGSVAAELIENNLGTRLLELETNHHPELSEAAEELRQAR